MKKILIAVLSLCCMACNDDIEVRRTIDSNLLIPKNGLQTVTYTADQTTLTYEVCVYRSGYNEGSSNASLYIDAEALANYNKKHKTEYLLMPVSCYSMPEKSVHLTNGSFMQGVTISFKLSDIPEGDYVLPITVKSEDETPVSKASQTVLITLEKEVENE